MLYCEECFKKLSADSLYCNVCGAKINDDIRADYRQSEEGKKEIVDVGVERICKDYDKICWVGKDYENQWITVISMQDGKEVLDWYVGPFDDYFFPEPISAEEVVVYGIDLEVRIVVKFSTSIMVLDNCGNKISQIYTKPEDITLLQSTFLSWIDKSKDVKCAHLLNLKNGEHVVLPYYETYSWKLYVNRLTDTSMVRYEYTKEGKRFAAWFFGGIYGAFKKITKEEGTLFLTESGTCSYERERVLKMSWKQYEKIKTYAEKNYYDSRFEPQQVLWDYLHMIGFEVLEDLGNNYYYVKGIFNWKELKWSYYILNMNHAYAFLNMDFGTNPAFFYSVYTPQLAIEEMEETYPWVLQKTDSFPYTKVSQICNDKLYCFKGELDSNEPMKMKIFEHLSELSYEKDVVNPFWDVNVKVYRYSNMEKRIIVSKNPDDKNGLILIFNEKMELIFEKYGRLTYDRLCYQFELLVSRCNGRIYYGLCDEHTGKELLPCFYDDIIIWGKKYGSKYQYADDNIIICTVQRDENDNFLSPTKEPKVQYFKYDAEKGLSLIKNNGGEYPVYGMREEQIAKLSYVNIAFESDNRKEELHEL